MLEKDVPDPMNPTQIAKILPDWAAGRVSLKEIKGYSDDELFAIAHTAYFFLMQGKNQEAKTLFQGLAVIDPRNDYYYRALGVIHHKLGDATRAVEQFGYAIKRNPRSAAAYVNRAEVYISVKQFNEAAKDLQRALQVVTAKEPQLMRKVKALTRMARKSAMASR